MFRVVGKNEKPVLRPRLRAVLKVNELLHCRGVSRASRHLRVTLSVTDSVSRTSITSQLTGVSNRTVVDVGDDAKKPDMRDTAIFARSLGSTPRSPNRNPVADITGSCIQCQMAESR